jgi:fructoselysine-6-P-deglycase FrlB-like protein
MTDQGGAPIGAGLAAIEKEMARQGGDAAHSFATAREQAGALAVAIRSTGRLLLLGMGASHAAGRIVEPLYRRLGIDAVAIPLSEHLTAPVPVGDKTVIVTSQSGESAELIRWLDEVGKRDGVYGMTLEPHSTLARAVPSLVGSGGAEVAFAATRSLVVTLALHLAVLAGLGEDPAPALQALRSPAKPDLRGALDSLASVEAVVASARQLQGLAEAVALGITELSRLPAFALEGGQFRHGPPEMLGPKVGVVLLRSSEAGASLVANSARLALEAKCEVVFFDASGDLSIPGAVNLRWTRSAGLAAVLTMLPTAQRLMLDFAASRWADVGVPRRSSKITKTE